MTASLPEGLMSGGIRLGSVAVRIESQGVRNCCPSMTGITEKGGMLRRK